MTGKTMAVYRKEILDTLRDGRSVFAIFVFPFVLYPGMLALMSWVEAENRSEAKEFAVRVGIVGEAQLPGAPALVGAVEGVSVVPFEREPASLEEADVQALLVIPGDLRDRLARGDSAVVELRYKDADNRSSETMQRLRPVLEQVRSELALEWARLHGAVAAAAPAIAVERKDISSKRDLGRYIAAMAIPYLLIFMVAAGSMQTAIDATTGEKERSTLETILATSASRGEIVVGKVMTVLTASIAGAFTSILGLWLAFGVLANFVPAMQSQSFELTLGPGQMLALFLTLLPAAVFLSAILVAIGCFARSMREGQTYATYVYMAAVFMGLASFQQSENPPLQNFFIPILNTALLQREILTGAVQSAHAFAAVGSSSLLAAVMMVIAVRLFSNEQVLFRS